MRRNGRDAPIPAIGVSPTELLSSTLSEHKHRHPAHHGCGSNGLERTLVAVSQRLVFDEDPGIFRFNRGAPSRL